LTYVLYLNLWGTTAKLSPDQVPFCQKYFHQRVRESAERFAVEAYPLVDYAYVYSSDLARLCTFAVDVFGAMIFPEGRAPLWPLRGAIARGAEPALGLEPIPWLGVGSVHAAELEKSAQKGMRLLIDHRALTGAVREPTREFAVRGTGQFEVNWLVPRLGEIDRERLVRVCADLMEEGTNYSQQLSASLSGLLRWADSVSGGN
jgi:hypothetical protein